MDATCWLVYPSDRLLTKKASALRFFYGWAYILGKNSQDHEMATENEGL